jgi:hypothetical protein
MLYTAMNCTLHIVKSFVTQTLYLKFYFPIHLTLVCGNSVCLMWLNIILYCVAKHYICQYLLLGWECISESNVFLWPISYSSRYWMDDGCMQCECMYVYESYMLISLMWLDVCIWLVNSKEQCSIFLFFGSEALSVCDHLLNTFINTKCTISWNPSIVTVTNTF